MPIITLPDGSHRSYPQTVTVYDIAADIGPGLARSALAGKVDGQLVDTLFQLDKDAEVAIITGQSEEGVDILRHSTAHLLAHAVKQLFPTAQVTIGPVIENGFYYDFAFERSFTPEDLATIEQRMEVLVAKDFEVQRTVMARDKAIQFFRNMGEKYKAEIISTIPEGQTISLYRQGDFIDLCRGPHVPSTGKLKAFKLTKVAGAYWRGDARNAVLQRIYGTAWPDKKSLKKHLHRLQEATKRDHRHLGRQLNLFHFQEEAPGMVFWHERGWTLYRIIEQYIRERLVAYNYQEVHTPQMLDRSLWEKSGHWEKFADDMFTTHSEHHEYAIKPMNCPAHVQIYNQGLKSHHDLPLRIAEFGIVHRNEPSGTLHGLLRTRRFTQDDAHIFCTEAQLQTEVAALIDLIFEVYQDFGFSEIAMALSTRPTKRVGEDELWDKAEAALKQALLEKELKFRLQPGEGAFYGPKIEFTLEDSIGRTWQCGTIQVDFSMPKRLGAHYIADDSHKRTPVMIHRAILGSLERFIGILIEHHAGALPSWLAPAQVVSLSITDRQIDYAKQITKSLCQQGLRATMDVRNEKIGYKIREHTLARCPYLLILGDREMAEETVSVRTRIGKDLGNMPVTQFATKLLDESAKRSKN